MGIFESVKYSWCIAQRERLVTQLTNVNAVADILTYREIKRRIDVLDLYIDCCVLSNPNLELPLTA